MLPVILEVGLPGIVARERSVTIPLSTLAYQDSIAA